MCIHFSIHRACLYLVNPISFEEDTYWNYFALSFYRASEAKVAVVIVVVVLLVVVVVVVEVVVVVAVVVVVVYDNTGWCR